MSDTNITKHPEAVHVGPATLCLMDETSDHLVVIGKVDDIIFEKLDPADEFLSEVVNGQRVETAGQPTFCGYQLRGKLTEALDPNTQYMVMKNCGTPAITSTCTIRTVTEDHLAFDDRCIKLKHNVGFYGEGALPAPGGVEGTLLAGIGSVPLGTYVFVVTALYGTTEGEHALSDPVVVAATAIYIAITAPGGGVVPDAYRIYVYDTDLGETIDDATLLQETDATQVVFEDIDRTGAAYPGEATSSFTITDSAGTPFQAGDDYTLDESCALVCFLSTGDIEMGEKVSVTYSYRENPHSEMTIGPADILPPYVHPVILAQKKDDRADPRPRGIEMHLWKVLASSGWSWDLSTLTFASGFEFTWRVLLSEKTLNHGRIESFNRHWESYDLANWLTLTDWHNGPSCEEATA